MSDGNVVFTCSWKRPKTVCWLQFSLNVQKLFHLFYFQYLCTEFDSHLVEIETANEDAFLSEEVKRLNGKKRG